MSAISAAVCRICSIQFSTEESHRCPQCGVDVKEVMGPDIVGLSRRNKPAAAPAPRQAAAASPVAVGSIKRDLALWQEALLSALKWGSVVGAISAAVGVVAGIALQPLITGGVSGAVGFTSAAMAGGGMGFLFGSCCGGIWGAMHRMEWGIAHGAMLGAIVGVVAAVVQQALEQAFLFGVSDVPIHYTALMGVMAGAVGGAFMGYILERVNT